MKNSLLIAFLFGSFFSFSQILDHSQGQTRAVVIGISDYQDEKIPDLKYAHRDAEAFANFLRSSSGGNLPDASIKLLLNKDATGGRMITSLDWLIDVSKEGDQAIIYFSGHGDVERVSKFQFGYLLPWDSPSSAYGAGAFSLIYLEAIIKTLSEEGVQVIVVSDACRAGKLAGSEFGGTQATTAALSKQYANEVKILSCQPEEFSLEGAQWGGGRGAFSYHLIDALYGMADDNKDHIVNLMEASRYLEERVPAETAPHQQIPFTVGNRSARLAIVNEEALAQWQDQKANEQIAFTKIDSKGLEELLLAKIDTNIQELYLAFNNALERGDLMIAMDSTKRSADELYEILINESALADLHGVMTRNFAAALIEEGQQVVNNYLKGDLKVWDQLDWDSPEYVGKLADQFYRAADLLGENHYFYPTLKSKALYFESYRVYSLPIAYVSARILDMKLMREAVSLDPNSPHVWTNIARNLPVDSADFYIDKLTEIAPNWPRWHYDFGVMYSQSYPEKAVQFFQRAIALDSTYLAPLIKIGLPLIKLERDIEATRYKKTAVRLGLRKLEKDTKSLANEEWEYLLSALGDLERYTEKKVVVKKFIAQDSTSADTYYSLGELLYNTYQFNEAEQMFKKGIIIDSTYTGLYNKLGWLYLVTRQLSKSEKMCKKAIEMDSTKTIAYYILGVIYYHTARLSEAEQMFKKMNLLDSYNQLGWVYIVTNQFSEAEIVLNKAISIDSTFNTPYSKLGLLYQLKNQSDKSENFYNKAKSMGYQTHYIFYNAACYFAFQNKQKEALDWFKKSLKAGFGDYNHVLSDLDLDPIRDTERFKELMKLYFPEKYN